MQHRKNAHGLRKETYKAWGHLTYIWLHSGLFFCLFFSEKEDARVHACTVEPRYYIPGKYDFPVITSIKMCDPMRTHIGANVFFSWRTHCHKVRLSWFFHCIFTVPRRKKSEKYVFGELGPAIHIFSRRADPFLGVTGTGKDTPGSLLYGDTLRHLWTVGTCFRFWVVSYLHHNNHG